MKLDPFPRFFPLDRAAAFSDGVFAVVITLLVLGIEVPSESGLTGAELDAMLTSSGHQLDVVVELTVDVDEVVSRLVKRAREQGRTDDTEDVLRRRLEVYADQTAPLIETYSDRGLLAKVDGMGTVDQVSERLLTVVSGG